MNNVSKAYPFTAVAKQQLIVDDVGGVPIFVLIGEDKKSVRSFERTVSGRKLEFFIKSNSQPLAIVDAETGSEWDFSGRAVRGPLAGHQLTQIPMLRDYWFDWRTYHADTSIYSAGLHPGM